MLTTSLLTVITSILSLTGALTIPPTDSPITDTSATASQAVGFDPTHCMLPKRGTNDWSDLHFQSDPLPDPNTLSSAHSSNGTTLRGDIPVPDPSVPVPDPDVSDECRQMRVFAFDNVEGFVRTKRVLLDWEDAEYYLTWTATGPIFVTVWKADSPGSEHFTKIYKQTYPDNRGQIRYTVTGGREMEIMVDLQLPPGGTSGEIALFSTHSFPKDHLEVVAEGDGESVARRAEIFG